MANRKGSSANCAETIRVAVLIVNDALVAAGATPLTFVAADNDLLAAAQAEELATENPNLHSWS